MIEKIKDLIKRKDMCVLATAFDNKPHCSLMAYVTDDDCGAIYMVTGRETTKYRNISANPQVSLLIDTREEHPGDSRPKAQALTVSGVFDFGDGTCDDQATFTFENGNVINISINEGRTMKLKRGMC